MGSQRGAGERRKGRERGAGGWYDLCTRKGPEIGGWEKSKLDGRSVQNRRGTQLKGKCKIMSDVKKLFRFQSLTIWNSAIELGDVLFDIADKLEKRKLYRFAEQLRGAGLSVSNNIAEGAGSDSYPDFRRFLNYARRSTFENANMVIVLARRGLLPTADANELLSRLVVLSKQITSFKKRL